MSGLLDPNTDTCVDTTVTLTPHYLLHLCQISHPAISNPRLETSACEFVFGLWITPHSSQQEPGVV